jgi:ATP-dependent DNA helicase RecG
MAPTEILAKQHFHTVSGFLAPLGVRVGLFTGSVKSRTVSDPNLFSEENAYDIYVGTHALLSASVDFDDCALVVIDEQQRFGVLQRTHLKQKAKKSLTPHLLTMTATPIPRSVTLTFYGNLDLSTLSELPKGRHPVKTWAVPNAKREGAYRWMREQLTRNHAQAFIVCPLIEESETLATVRATTAEYTRLSRDVFPELRLSLLHGRMKPREKDLIMASFRSHSSDILVTTPVVEVGIDVPNATIMLIEAAERFGLAQLHQLRGRVGRGEKSSYCLLFTEKDDEKTLARLHALEKYHSGPELAQIDLTLRGPGDIFGTKQHGLPVFTVASFADAALIDETKQAINTLTGSDPELGTIPDLRERLKRSTIPATSQD